MLLAVCRIHPPLGGPARLIGRSSGRAGLDLPVYVRHADVCDGIQEGSQIEGGVLHGGVADAVARDRRDVRRVAADVQGVKIAADPPLAGPLADLDRGTGLKLGGESTGPTGSGCRSRGKSPFVPSLSISTWTSPRFSSSASLNTSPSKGISPIQRQKRLSLRQRFGRRRHVAEGIENPFDDDASSRGRQRSSDGA